MASAAATRVSDGRATGIAVGSASYSVPIRRLRLEAGGTASILGTSDLRPASSWLGFGRAHLVGRASGIWIGGSAGDVHLESSTFRATTGDLGAWVRRGPQRLTLAATSVRTSLVETVIYSDQTVVRAREPVRYADVSLIAHGEWRRFELDATATSRHVSKGNLASIPTAAVSGAWWVMPNVGIAAAIGRQLSDPVRGTTHARYAAIALRFSAERHGPTRAARTPPVLNGEPSIAAVPADGGMVTVRVYAPDAQRVELMGDLTGWEPTPLERRSGRWEARLTAAAGAHHVMVRIDGGRWVVPGNLPRIDDELGGHVGLLIVP